MFRLLSFAIGAGITSYSWYKLATDDKEDKETTFLDELMPALKVISLLLTAIILISYLKKRKAAP